MKAPVIAFVLFHLAFRAMAGDAPTKFSIDFMDRDIDPGSDFFRFACGGWLKKNSIPPDKRSWGPYLETEEHIWDRIHVILDICAEAKPERDAAQAKVGDFFASGTDIAARNKAGFAPLDETFARIEAASDKAECAAVLAWLHLRGAGGLFAVGVWPDERKSTTHAFELWQSDDAFGLPDRDYYLLKEHAKERDAYRGHIIATLRLAGEADTEASAQAATIIRLEGAIAKICKPRDELQDSVKNYNKVTSAQLLHLAPDFSWVAYFKALDAPMPETLVLGQPEVLRHLAILWKTEPLADWKVYLRWRAISSASAYLTEAVEKERFAFYGTVLAGQPEQEPLWKRVAGKIDDLIGEALGRLYVEKYVPAETKTRVEEMAHNFQGAYRKRLEKVPWMTEATRQNAVAKLDKFIWKVAFPDKFRDYAAVEVRRDDYLGNMQRASLAEWQRDLGRIGQSVDRTEWNCTPQTLNAFFFSSENSVTLPAGILQPPMYDLEMDDAVNYGNIGATIGHEMTHGFDSDGRQYDAEGNLRDWWTKNDAKQFQARAQKLIDQFNAFSPLPGTHVNGKLTLAENIADFGGLLIAWDALQHALEADPTRRKTIDGFTPEQRFFISYAQSWCTIRRDESVRQSLLTDVHAPDQFRAIAPLLHMPEFYEAFKIKAGSKMWLPPAKRATIW